jgi:tyrosyl-tRNA synthetase
MAGMPPPDRDFALLAKGAVDLVDAASLEEKLSRSRRDGRPLTVKVGFDPSAPDIHLGHTVLLRKMRHFQDAGHRVIFLIGDFTGLIGDPSGKKSTRPQLTRAEIEGNARTYAQQCYKVLDPARTEIRYNSEWFDTLGSAGFIRLASRITVARVLERDDFQRRWNAHQPISLHELLYPLSQAYDSVALKADVELGGTDQLFNLLLGRDLMREEGLEPQVVLTMPLLVGTDGVEKMSKSLGNAIGVNDPPAEIFGKVMSISDETMWNYWLLLTDLLPEEVDSLRGSIASGERHAMEVKKELAARIVRDFHGEDASVAARGEFERKFSKREIAPSDFPAVVLPAEGPGTVSKILVEAGLCESVRDAQRQISQGAVEWNGAPLKDAAATFERRPGVEHFVRVGKRRLAKIGFR